MEDGAIRTEMAKYWDGQSSRCGGERHRFRWACRFPEWKVLLENALGPGPMRILDLGTGSGEIAMILAGSGHRVVGVDLSEAMLSRARSEARRRGVQVEFLGRDAEATGFPDASFDAIVCRNLLWTLPSPFAAMREWKRILAPRGILLILDGEWLAGRSERLPGAILDYRSRGIVSCAPLHGLPRPATDLEILGRLGFVCSWMPLDFHGGCEGPQAYSRQFLVRGVVA